VPPTCLPPVRAPACPGLQIKSRTCSWHVACDNCPACCRC
jgi:hypothetical protein